MGKIYSVTSHWDELESGVSFVEAGMLLVFLYPKVKSYSFG